MWTQPGRCCPTGNIWGKEYISLGLHRRGTGQFWTWAVTVTIAEQGDQWTQKFKFHQRKKKQIKCSGEGQACWKGKSWSLGQKCEDGKYYDAGVAFFFWIYWFDLIVCQGSVFCASVHLYSTQPKKEIRTRDKKCIHLHNITITEDNTSMKVLQRL